MNDSAIHHSHPPKRLPLLAVTLGDPAGVGPEVIVKALADARVYDRCRPIVLGHPEVLREAAELVGSPGRIVTIDDSEIADCEPTLDRIVCLPVGDDNLLEVPHCTVDARTGHAAYEALVRAIEGAKHGPFDGIVTAPLNKEALNAAGHDYPGHTELLAERCGVEDFAMMLYLPPEELPNCPHGLGVVHVTLHVALRDIFARLTTAAVLAKCQLADRSMREGFGLDKPRIGVCALNPHAGEQGLFGAEEARIIAPAVQLARQQGIDATGPDPPDTLMVRAQQGEFDAVVAMYHDQGHIALKLIGMHRAVNVTLGLPIIRTSVAHGTAFDRAWQGTAESSGMIAALTVAAEMAKRKSA